jgi:hypothetical protein
MSDQTHLPAGHQHPPSELPMGNRLHVPAAGTDYGLALRVLQVFLVTGFVLVGLLPLPGGVQQGLNDTFPMWQNLHLVRVAFIIAAISLAAVLLRFRAGSVRSQGVFLLHLLATVLVIHVALVAVLLWKYMTWRIPDTWTAELIYLYSVQTSSLSDLYAIGQLEQPPFTTPLYPPGYIAILKGLYAVLGESPAVMRALTVASLLAISVGLAFASSYRATRDRWMLLAPALFLALFPVLTWSGAPSKPEFVAAALSVAGFSIYLRFGHVSAGRWVIPAGLLFGFALLAKYTVIAAFLATVVHLALQKRYRDTALLFALVVVVFGVVYGYLWWTTDGGVLLFTVTANAARPDFFRLFSWAVLGVLPSAFVVLALAGALTLVLNSRGFASAGVAVALAFCISLALFILAAARPASSANYFLESAILGCLVLATLLHTQYRAQADSGNAGLLTALLLVLLSINLASQIALLARSEGDDVQDQVVRATLSELYVQPGEYVLTDPHYTYQLVQAGHTPLVLDNLMYTLMLDNGHISHAPFVQILLEGKVPFLILANTLEQHASLPYGQRRISPDVVSFLQSNYECEELLVMWDGALFVRCEYHAERLTPRS